MILKEVFATRKTVCPRELADRAILIDGDIGDTTEALI